MSILVDTGAWYAVADLSDRHHRVSRKFYTENAERGLFVTNELVAGETCALLTSHLGRKAALGFWQTLREAQIPILSAESVDLEAGWRIAQDFPDQAFSFVDCVTFAQMERLGIHDAFAFDAHFLVYRFGVGRRRSFRRLPR